MIFIIGGGVIGLHVAIAVAEDMPGHPDIVVCDQAPFLGDHTSGRNSQVIHAGFAYPIGSLKARLCVEGNPLSYEWLLRLGVTHHRCGKWVVAFHDEELPALAKVLEIGEACGAAGLREVSAADVAAAEPACHRFAGAVFSGTSGMMDAAGYLRALERYLTAQENCHLLYPCAVTAIDPVRHVVETTRGAMEYSLLINCAGLWADDIYAMTGGTRRLRIKPFKGEYYIWKDGRVASMIYPVPRRYLPGREHDKRLVSSMGVHLHRDTGGQLFVGPTQIELDWDQKTDYAVTTPREAFVEQASHYAPVMHPASFEMAYAGNRPKIYEDGKPLGDFLVFREGDCHLHLLGIDSPGLTAAPAMARYVAQLARG
ncbi:MAG: FAD-dependent oxidoreductase [Deltaproteobacteria bacterium]|nr:FAD-dependent oxidoreductase [Deltaproteobacteria bacterium]